MMDLAPLLYVGRAMEWSLLLPICGLLLVISTIFALSAISTIGCIDLPIVLLLLRVPLATWFKEPSLSLGGLNAYISDYKQISHCLGLLHGDFLDSLDIANPIMKAIDDFDVLDVRDSVLGIAEMFHIVSEAFIIFLLDGLQGFSCRRTLICTLKIPDEHGP
jgi:hypothetical protein